MMKRNMNFLQRRNITSVFMAISPNDFSMNLMKQPNEYSVTRNFIRNPSSRLG